MLCKELLLQKFSSPIAVRMNASIVTAISKRTIPLVDTPETFSTTVYQIKEILLLRMLSFMRPLHG
jgi:hypothetical protein